MEPPSGRRVASDGAAAREASRSIGPELHVSPREGGGFDSRYSIRQWRRIPRGQVWL